MSSLKSRDQFAPKKRVNFIVYFCFEKMFKFAKNLEPRKAWSAMFFSIFYHHGIQKNPQQHCRSVFWKEFNNVLDFNTNGLPWWLDGYSTEIWIRGWGFDSSSLRRTSFYSLKFFKTNWHQILHFLKNTWNKSSNKKMPFWQVEMKKMWVLQYANKKVVGYTAVLTAKSGWTSLSSLLSFVSCRLWFAWIEVNEE